MTEVCRFDFNSICVAVFDRDSAGAAQAQWVHTNYLLSHDRESFFGCSGRQTLANRRQGVQMISTRNFSVYAKTLSAPRQRRLLMAARGGLADPLSDLELEEKAASLFATEWTRLG